MDFGLHGENAGLRSVLEHAGWTLAEECRVRVRSLAGASPPARPKTRSPSRPEPFPNFPGCTTGRRACTGTAPGCGQRFGDLAEIFGVDFEGEFDGEARTALLAQSLAEARRTRKIVNSFAQNP